MDLTQEIYDRAAKFSAIRARESGDDRFAFKVDDVVAAKQWVIDGTLEAAVKCGIMKYDSGEVAEPDVLPDELLNSVVYFVLMQYYAAVGGDAIRESAYWQNRQQEELSKYRFNPRDKSTATRKYNVGL